MLGMILEAVEHTKRRRGASFEGGIFLSMKVFEHTFVEGMLGSLLLFRWFFIHRGEG